MKFSPDERKGNINSDRTPVSLHLHLYFHLLDWDWGLCCWGLSATADFTHPTGRNLCLLLAPLDLCLVPCPYLFNNIGYVLFNWLREGDHKDACL
jgi:hypothetical protein